VATTYVHYMYHAPGSTEGVEIATERWPNKEPQDVLPLVGSAGSSIVVPPDDPDEHGDMRGFKVLSVVMGPTTSWRGSQQATLSNVLLVSVTDLD
jgi:hypothetical protein